MLSILFTENKEAQIWVGQNTHLSYLEKYRVQDIQADGHELEYIKKNFQNVPFSKIARVQIWRGDIAQFIVDNLNW